jgi:hypothetical protein
VWLRLGFGLSFCERKLDFALTLALPGMVDQHFEMHPDFSKAAGLTSAIIGAAIEVHRGLIDSRIRNLDRREQRSQTMHLLR